MDNPKTMVTLGTQDTRKTNKYKNIAQHRNLKTSATRTPPV